MTGASITLSTADGMASESAPVWVLDDPRAGTSGQVIGIAERLGLPFRLVPLDFNWRAHLASLVPGGSLAGLAPPSFGTQGSGPALVLSAGSRAAPVARWLRRRYGCRLVHCMRPGLGAGDFDLLVIGAHDHPPDSPRILPVLGAPHRLSPRHLQQAGEDWAERLAHLPRPRIALMLGGGRMLSVPAQRLGMQVAALARHLGGSVMASASRRTGAAASEALGQGLGGALHLLYRWGEPGPNPYAGFLALADAIVVSGDSVSMISEACATSAPVLIALPELGGRRHRRLHASLYAAGQAQPFPGEPTATLPAGHIAVPLDEAGRVAAEIRRRFSLGADLSRLNPLTPRPRHGASPMKRTHRIAVIPGDGIGQETVPEGLRVLDAAARRFGFALHLQPYDWSCARWRETGAMMPEDGLDRLRASDAIFLGAVGWPGVPDHVSLWGLLIPMRRGFDQYVNLRPCRLMPGVRSPLAGRREAEIDFIVVRENTEGEYSSSGGRMFAGTAREFVTQESVFTRHGVDRVMRYAFELARTRPRRHLTSATKSNGITFTMPFWDERFAAMAAQFPDVTTAQFHIDILCAHFVQHPDWFDVVVGSNLFGDILSDLGPAVAGSIGIAPSANINPERAHPSMFEPVHGSAPDIAGQHVCNPIGQIWSAALMLRHLGEAEAADAIEAAIERLLREGGPRTRDMGGEARTEEVGAAIAALLADG
jgi:tartrate dehydrogenase/decarboxylase/D-malate dehydrogenase